MHTAAVVPYLEHELAGVPFGDIDALERAMLAGGNRVDVETTHRFAPGLYAREVRITAGTLLTGKTHRTRHLNVVSAGVIAVFTAAEGWREIRAPFTFVAEPGTRRVGYAIEDTVWTTIHGTDETDLERLEAELIEPAPSPHAAPQEVLCRG